MTNTPKDDNLHRLLDEEVAAGNRLFTLKERKAEFESPLPKMDEMHWHLVRQINDLSQHLSHLTDELRSLNHERTERTQELRHVASDIKDAARELRTLRRTIRETVGRDVCPACGSTEIASITYGYPVEGFKDDEPVVMGGCGVNPDETVSCLDCGKKFLGNLDRWQRTQLESSKPETVLKVGAEGGTLAIVRQRNQHGKLEYWSLRDETTMLGLLQEDDIGNRDDFFKQSTHLGSFEDALLRLDEYPWFRLVPLRVSEEFADLVLREVMTRGGKEAAMEWMENLKRHRFDD